MCAKNPKNQSSQSLDFFWTDERMDGRTDKSEFMGRPFHVGPKKLVAPSESVSKN